MATTKKTSARKPAAKKNPTTSKPRRKDPARARAEKKDEAATEGEARGPDPAEVDTTSETEAPPVYAHEVGDDAGAPAPTLVPGEATLGQLADAFCCHLEEDGKAPGTVRSYHGELRMACLVLGADTKLVDLTPAMVESFYEHVRVTTTRDGQPKAAVGIAKTRRVLRLALIWAAEKGVISEAPLPATDE